MRRLLRHTLAVLDGTPADYGRRERGQSMAELMLVTPILIILLCGLVEVGWYANNYLILMEVTRVGARFGTLQEGDNIPLRWHNAGSISPFVGGATGGSTDRRNQVRDCANTTRDGFYKRVVCLMRQSMDPLQLADVTQPDTIDDIVISVFAVNRLRSGNFPTTPANLRTDLDDDPAFPADEPQMIVTARYPTNANECYVAGTQRLDSRDPFDFINNNTSDVAWEVDPGDGNVPPSNAFTDPNITFHTQEPSGQRVDEIQRGFAYYGRHIIRASAGQPWQCYGSEWGIDDVERLLNLPTLQARTTVDQTVERVRFPASQALVVVEIFWRHRLLLDIPAYSPVYNALGGNTTPIYVWAAFPVPSAETRIQGLILNNREQNRPD